MAKVRRPRNGADGRAWAHQEGGAPCAPSDARRLPPQYRYMWPTQGRTAPSATGVGAMRGTTVPRSLLLCGVAGSHSRGAHSFSGAHGIDEESGAPAHPAGLSYGAVVEPVGRRPRREHHLEARLVAKVGASPRPSTCAGSVSHRLGRRPRSGSVGEASAGGASHLLRHPGAGELSLGRRLVGPGCGLATRRERPPDGLVGPTLTATRRQPVTAPRSGPHDGHDVVGRLSWPASPEGAPRRLSGGSTIA